MNRKLQLLVVCLFLMGFQTAFSQEVSKNEPRKATKVELPSKIEKRTSLASRKASWKVIDPSKDEYRDGRYKRRSSKIDLVIGKGSTGDDILAKNPNPSKNTIRRRTASLIFDTASSPIDGGRPSDPSGAVGPDHYFSVTNVAFQIFDKSGNSLTGLLPSSEIFSAEDCCDLTVTYDNNANRWVMSILIGLGEGIRVAISEGPDPVNDGWTVFTWTGNDYNKLSVWRDGYYITDNSSTQLHVFERASMIDNDPSTVPQIVSFSLPGIVAGGGFLGTQVLNISSDDWPTTGGATVVYLQDDAYPGISEDQLKLWTVNMDWINPSNSTVSAAQVLGAADGVTPYVSIFDGGNFENLAQPNGGGSIDVLQAVIMNQAQYRRFPAHNSAVINFVVDVDGSSDKQAGVRWYELRQTTDGAPWTIHQEGTYTAPDNRHAWNASMIMDSQGNIGMGYSSMSSVNSSNSQVYAGSYYTGRFAADPLGTMTVAEEVIRAGNGNFETERFGDYSKIDIDPIGDKKFWYVNELVDTDIKNVAGVFQIAPTLPHDLGVTQVNAPVTGALSATQSITVTIFNFGLNSESTFNVTYQIDGGALISEAYNGAAIAPGQSAQFTFSQTADMSTEGQTYTVTGSTDLSTDDDNNNDSRTIEATHVYANDLGVLAITSPVTDNALGNEQVVVTLKNFGTASQSNFNVAYNINGGAQIVEQVPGPLAGGSTTSYTFSTLANLSTDGSYTIVAETQLGSDSVPSNNSVEVTVDNTSCLEGSNNTEFDILPNLNDPVTESVISITEDEIISDVNVTVNIQHNWITDIDMKLIGPDGTEVVLANDVGGDGDNMTNTVFDDDAATSIGSGAPPFTGTFRPLGSLADFNGLSSLGNWTLHINDDEDAIGGTLLGWSIEICSTPLSIDDETLVGDLKILNQGNDQFRIVLTSDTLTENVDLNIYNLLGQNLLWKTMKNEDGEYSYNLDMSYAASGIYLIRLGTETSGITRRIVVE